MLGNFAGSHTQRNCCVEDARAVEVHRHALLVRDVRYRFHVGEREHRAAGAVVRVLHPDERRAHLVARGRPDRLVEQVEIHRPALTRYAAEEEPRDGGDAAQFRVQRVRAVLEHDLAAAATMGKHCDQVGHRAARHESAGFLVQALGGHRFELLHGRVAVARVVAEGGLAHRLEHRFGGTGEGVASEIDHVKNLAKSELNRQDSF